MKYLTCKALWSQKFFKNYFKIFALEKYNRKSIKDFQK